MSRYNRFEVDGRGRVFVNGVEVDDVRKIKTQVEEFGTNVVELTFETDETVVSTTRKPKSGCMDFGQAIEALKRGRKIAREGWNGKDMFLYYVPAASYPPSTDIAKKAFGGEAVPYGAYIAMKTAQNNVVPWSASQTDMLSEDWMIVE